MHSQSEHALRELRSKMAAEVATLKDLENKFEHPYFKKRAQRAIKDTEEAEIIFLRPLEKESWRDAQQEARVIGYANAIFQMAVAQRKQLQDFIAKYGPKATVVPYP